VAHLREGGTTPWRDWYGVAPAGGRVLPGAQQLELLRRANLAAGSRRRGSSTPAGLADRVLAASAAGRGHADLPLVGAGEPTFGARPLDPAELPARELLRVASTLLAEDLAELGADPLPTTWTRPWRRRVRLIGDPVVVAEVGDELAARGRPLGGTGALVVVAAAPLDTLLEHTWTQRCFEHGSRPWEDWLRFWSERGQLPVRADLPDAVRRWGPRRPLVRVVTDPRRLPRTLGVRRLPRTTVPGADQAELARRIAAVAGLLVPAEERPGLMRTLRGRMPRTTTPPVRLPEWARPWVDASAERMTRELRRADYPVVGDLADLTPVWEGGATPRPRAELDHLVLDLALRMLVDPTWRMDPESREEEA
jgi:hypothetical protein